MKQIECLEITESFQELLYAKLNSKELSIIVREYIPYPMDKIHIVSTRWQADNLYRPFEHVIRDLNDNLSPTASILQVIFVFNPDFPQNVKTSYLRKVFENSDIKKRLRESATVQEFEFTAFTVDTGGKVAAYHPDISSKLDPSKKTTSGQRENTLSFIMKLLK